MPLYTIQWCQNPLRYVIIVMYLYSIQWHQYLLRYVIFVMDLIYSNIDIYSFVYLSIGTYVCHGIISGIVHRGTITLSISTTSAEVSSMPRTIVALERPCIWSNETPIGSTSQVQLYRCVHISDRAHQGLIGTKVHRYIVWRDPSRFYLLALARQMYTSVPAPAIFPPPELLPYIEYALHL